MFVIIYIGELADAIRSNTDMHFGLYHSQYEWFNPLFLQDKANNLTTQDFVNVSINDLWKNTNHLSLIPNLYIFTDILSFIAKNC